LPSAKVEVGGDIVQRTFLILLAGLVLALALAFGLGGKEWAAAMLERWWPGTRETTTPDALLTAEPAAAVAPT